MNRSQLWAEPTVINLRYRNPSYYEMGNRYAQLSQNPSLLILLLKFLFVVIDYVEHFLIDPNN